MGFSSAVAAPASKAYAIGSQTFLTKLKIVNQTGHATAVVLVLTQKVTADL